jgi:hypothetical protein
VNEASIKFSPPDATKPAPHEPHDIKLPDGYNTWAAAWMRGGTVLWVEDKSGVRSYDFSNPAKVKEQAAEADNVPPEIREALRAALAVPEPKPAPKGGANAMPPPAAARP